MNIEVIRATETSDSDVIHGDTFDCIRMEKIL